MPQEDKSLEKRTGPFDADERSLPRRQLCRRDDWPAAFLTAQPHFVLVLRDEDLFLIRAVVFDFDQACGSYGVDRCLDALEVTRAVQPDRDRLGHVGHRFFQVEQRGIAPRSRTTSVSA